MARMIPTRISSGCKSPGEKMLFRKFRDDPDTSDWTVLHSLDTARHVRQVEGEADFVVLVPDLGVLCLEVKAGDVKRKDGMWLYKYGTDRRESARSPFQQASEAMHSVRNYVVGQNALLKHVLFYSAVVFTRIDFDENSSEWHQWQFIDRTEVNRQPVSHWCMEILRSAHKHVSTRQTSGWYDPSSAKPTRKQTDAIAKLLRPDFDYFRLPREEVAETDLELLKYTENQFKALDALEENPRTLFKGLAGTGKTLIALEAARRSTADGKKTLFVCFNKMLGAWLAEQAEKIASETGGEIRCGTLHSILLATADCDVTDSTDAKFWHETLPALAIEKLLQADDDAYVYDQLIVDECQDFVEEGYFDFLDLGLAGGLSAGSWAIFGDFEKQAVYGHKVDAQALLAARSPGHTVFRLTDNCRNAFPVAKSIEFLCAPDPGYKKILHQGRSAEISVSFISDQEAQAKRLEVELLTLSKKFDENDIVVLSARADKRSCAGKLNASGRDKVRLRKLTSTDGTKGIRFGSIHAFKGLEAAAVVITDIDSIKSEYEQSLLYVGMSRARQKLVLLLNDACKADYMSALEASFGSDNG